MSTNPPAGTPPPALPIALKVSFTLTTPDRKRQISFGLEKDTDGVKVNWTITFVLSELTDPNQSHSQPGVLPCKLGTNFETGHYTIAHTRLDDPFKFLYWVGGKTRNVETQLAAQLNGQPFTYKLAVTDALSLIEKARFMPDGAKSFSIRIELVSVQNCDPNAKTLELIYRIYSTDPPKILGGATESQVTAKKSQQTTTGLAQAGNPFHFTPSGGYNRSYRAFGGGRVQITKLGGLHLFDALTADRQGSN